MCDVCTMRGVYGRECVCALVHIELKGGVSLYVYGVVNDVIWLGTEHSTHQQQLQAVPYIETLQVSGGVSHQQVRSGGLLRRYDGLLPCQHPTIWKRMEAS